MHSCIYKGYWLRLWFKDLLQLIKLFPAGSSGDDSLGACIKNMGFRGSKRVVLNHYSQDAVWKSVEIFWVITVTEEFYAT